MLLFLCTTQVAAPPLRRKASKYTSTFLVLRKNGKAELPWSCRNWNTSIAVAGSRLITPDTLTSHFLFSVLTSRFLV